VGAAKRNTIKAIEKTVAVVKVVTDTHLIREVNVINERALEAAVND